MSACEDGTITSYDIRKGQIWQAKKAHNKACSYLASSPGISDIVASVGVDGYCRIWDM